jgi:hypothetical protein
MLALVGLLLGFSALVQGAEPPRGAPPPSDDRLKLVRPEHYFGMCDASGAVPISSNLFAVASDEDNILRIYRNDQPGRPVKEFDLNAFLGVQGHSLEADLEGAARIGDRAFWIGSHGRNVNGKERLNRHRLFATDIHGSGAELTLTPVGQPYCRLLDDLLADQRFTRFHLAEAAGHAPKEAEALNIEGLSATPEGHLLIGFRNPVPDGKALLIPLLNPNEVIQGKGARFDAAIQLELHGLGIRDMAWHAGTYIIIAGSYHGGGHFRLYRWAGPGAKAERLRVDHLDDYHPEALIIYPDRGPREFQVLSDDGTLLIDNCPCKDLVDPNRRTFRSFWVAAER